jgi:hypothetical protein
MGGYMLHSSSWRTELGCDFEEGEMDLSLQNWRRLYPTFAAQSREMFGRGAFRTSWTLAQAATVFHKRSFTQDSSEFLGLARGEGSTYQIIRSAHHATLLPAWAGAVR